MKPIKIARTKAKTDPVHTGNHPMNVKRIILKKVETGIVITADSPFVAINVATRTPMVTIREEIIPASAVEVFIKSATF